MIPLKDCIKPRRFPFVNYSLILFTIIIFFYELTLSPRNLDQLLAAYAVIPVKITWFFLHPWVITGANVLPLVTSIFLHGGWVHLLGNMLYLWIFGDNVEDRIGHLRFLLFYLLAGIIGNIAQVLSNPYSTSPLIGASGAIAGVLGAYVIAFPRARILTLLIVIFFVTTVRIPALFFIAFWFILQLFNGLAVLSGAVSPVGWWAHIGGFLTGLLVMHILHQRADLSEWGCKDRF
ncbi:MAG: rhomboid family intramembrane serine protease [Firmicutes bacterium]|nr:rhomboid family intramembrane serine protease [Bacillota bacterium]